MMEGVTLFFVQGSTSLVLTDVATGAIAATAMLKSRPRVASASNIHAGRKKSGPADSFLHLAAPLRRSRSHSKALRPMPLRGRSRGLERNASGHVSCPRRDGVTRRNAQHDVGSGVEIFSVRDSTALDRTSSVHFVESSAECDAATFAGAFDAASVTGGGR